MTTQVTDILPLVNRPFVDEMRRRGREEMNKPETFHNLVAVPFCIGDVVWRMTDTVTDIMTQLRVSALKKVCRMMKEYRIEYEHSLKSKAAIEAGRFKIVNAWGDNFMDLTDGDAPMYARINAETKRLYPDLDSDWRIMINAAYIAWVYAKGLIMHTDEHERKFAKNIGLREVGHILPPHFYGLIPLLEAVFCENKLPDSFTLPLIEETRAFLKVLAEEGSEPKPRTAYRQRCIAFVCNGGCKAQAQPGEKFGCYPTSRCKRMCNYDKRAGSIHSNT
jgi:hypothetical protein